MTDDTTNRGATDQWMRLWAPWTSFAPRDLSQPINPGWSFGNVIVNQRNSGSPETEQAILAEESYGRQIGKLLDAVHALIEEKPGRTATNAAFRDIEALREKVERLKREAAGKRIDQIKSDLELLKTSDKAAYEAKIEALRSLLPEPRAAGS